MNNSLYKEKIEIFFSSIIQKLETKFQKDLNDLHKMKLDFCDINTNIDLLFKEKYGKAPVLSTIVPIIYVINQCKSEIDTNLINSKYDSTYENTSNSSRMLVNHNLGVRDESNKTDLSEDYNILNIRKINKRKIKLNNLKSFDKKNKNLYRSITPILSNILALKNGIIHKKVKNKPEKRNGKINVNKEHNKYMQIRTIEKLKRDFLKNEIKLKFNEKNKIEEIKKKLKNEIMLEEENLINKKMKKNKIKSVFNNNNSKLKFLEKLKPVSNKKKSIESNDEKNFFNFQESNIDSKYTNMGNFKKVMDKIIANPNKIVNFQKKKFIKKDLKNLNNFKNEISKEINNKKSKENKKKFYLSSIFEINNKNEINKISESKEIKLENEYKAKQYINKFI